MEALARIDAYLDGQLAPLETDLFERRGPRVGVDQHQGRLGDARKHLEQVSAENDQQRVQLTQAEAQLLREAAAYQDAFDLLGRALEKLPDYPDLLYDHAMAAEKVNRFDVLESNLRKLIRIRPDYAHAYNALGYTMADRNERLPGSTYATLANCIFELREAEALMRHEGIPYLDVTSKSVEELATTILQQAKLERRVY